VQPVVTKSEGVSSATGALPPLKKSDLNAAIEGKSLKIPTFLQKN
jgi:hypothetical protein